MPLNWNIEKVKNWQAISYKPENGVEGAKTDRLIWACIEVNMSGITKENVDEFWRRFEPIADSYAVLWKHRHDSDPIKYLITKDDLIRRIGLYTNVSTLSKTAYNRLKKKEKVKIA